MKNFEYLIKTDRTTDLTFEESEFINVHRRIIASASLVGQYLFEMCSQIKRMRDGKLYLAAGFEKFEDYTEQALKVKRRQAYTYIKLAETYTENYIIENAEAGITKLSLLANVTEEERQEIIEALNIREATVIEVEGAVKAAVRERDEAQKQAEIYAEKNEELQSKLSASESDYAELSDDFDKKEQELKDARARAEDLKKEALALEKALAEAKKASKEIKTVPDEQSKKVAAAEKARADELEAKLKETNLQLAAAKEQKKTLASDDLLIFKVKFNDLQRLGVEIKKSLDGMAEENAAKCRTALNAVLDKWKGEMQL